MTEVKEKKPKKRYVYLDKYEKLEKRVAKIESWLVYLVLCSIAISLYAALNK